MEDIRYLKITLESAEKTHTDALRRLQWLERRLMDAQTQEEYDHIKELLDKQEEYTKETGKIEMQARWKYAAATI